MPERSFTISTTRDFPYYRKVWKKVIAILVIAAFLPLVLIGGGMYFYLARTIKHKSINALQTEVISHKKDIDSFLTERIRDLKLIAENNSLSRMISPGTVEDVLFSLQQELPCFQDLGIIGPEGEHLAYTGPYDLMAKNYRRSIWFKAVIKEGVYVSDVFTGFRNEPHFIVAVRQNEGKNSWILRATIMSDLFDNIVTQVLENKKGNAYLINRKGYFQANPRKGDELMMKSSISYLDRFKGVRIEEEGSTLILTIWLETVPWLSVVSIDKKDLFEDIRKVRNIGLFIFLLGGFLIILAIFLTTDNLVSMLEEKRKGNRHMGNRLRRTVFLAASMKLSKGVFSDLNDILSNIHVTATLIKEKGGPENSRETDPMAEQISSEAIRGRNLIDGFARFVRPEEPIIMDLDIHRMVNRLIGFLKPSLIEKNINLITDFQAELPHVRSDGAALRQIFLNLLLNAAAVIGTNGKICISTSIKEKMVIISISDDGPALWNVDIEPIFTSHHLTSRGDWGFGLSISRFNIESIGGVISVKNGKEKGAIFEVRVPMEFNGKFSGSKLVIQN